MAADARQYRIVYYGSDRDAYVGHVTLRWHWSWRAGLDPLWECWQAQKAKQSLAVRAQEIADRVNAEIMGEPCDSARRFDLLEEHDAVDGDQVTLIRSDLVAVQLATAHLSCLAVKAALKRLTSGGSA